MAHEADRTADVVPATLDREAGLIRDAIAMVASGASPRVVVAGIHFGDALLDSAQAMAAHAHVRLVPLWRSDDTGATDLAVERISE